MTIEAIRQHKARNSTSLVLKRFQAAELLPEDFSRAPDGVFPDDDNDEGGEEHASGLKHVRPDDRLKAADRGVKYADLSIILDLSYTKLRSFSVFCHKYHTRSKLHKTKKFQRILPQVIA